MLKELLNEILLSESASPDEVTDSIDNHHRILINYVSKTKEVADGPRIIEVYAYGLSKAGNPVIRAFQPFGDTASSVPSWKFFRLDGITHWQDKKQVFSTPASDRYPGVGKFNPDDDKTMSVVYKIATFDDEEQTGYERLMQQLNNPIKIDSLQKSKQEEPQTPEPEAPTPAPAEPKSDVYHTPTETGYSSLLGQLNNPNIRKIDLSKFEKKPKTQQELDKQKQSDDKQLDKVKDLIKQKDNFTKQELDQAVTPEPETPAPEEPKSDVFRTPTETGMANLRNQLQSPRKIDLSKIPKR